MQTQIKLFFAISNYPLNDKRKSYLYMTIDVTYNNYPTLLFMSFDNEMTPSEPVFELVRNDVSDYLKWRPIYLFVALQR